jgi:hypothetical protein
MDLKQLDSVAAANEGRELIIIDPATNKDTDIKIILAGMDSEIYQKLDREASRKRFKMLKKRQELNLTPEEVEEEQLQLLVSCTLGWSGMTEGGKELAFNSSEARRVYQQYPVIKRQVMAFVGSEANFLPESGTHFAKPSKQK